MLVINQTSNIYTIRDDDEWQPSIPLIRLRHQLESDFSFHNVDCTPQTIIINPTRIDGHPNPLSTIQQAMREAQIKPLASPHTWRDLYHLFIAFGFDEDDHYSLSKDSQAQADLDSPINNTPHHYGIRCGWYEGGNEGYYAYIDLIGDQHTHPTRRLMTGKFFSRWKAEEATAIAQLFVKNGGHHYQAPIEIMPEILAHFDPSGESCQFADQSGALTLSLLQIIPLLARRGMPIHRHGNVALVERKATFNSVGNTVDALTFQEHILMLSRNLDIETTLSVPRTWRQLINIMRSLGLSDNWTLCHPIDENQPFDESNDLIACYARPGSSEGWEVHVDQFRQRNDRHQLDPRLMGIFWDLTAAQETVQIITNLINAPAAKPHLG